ncbi:hypothetical protein Taro_004176 [Colocasia esculenta]|uniref:BHLH domain-containing protein n=1 Tax=Colocasia esculenta TaxID=4460 RepID=A0A843TLM2_COLES|nr:hypothetical protein [Colocasia esculenta]
MMPLPEFHSSMKGKHEPSQPKTTTCSAPDLSSFVPGQEFIELLWENGQIVMQDQSSRPRKSSSPGGKAQEQGGGDTVPPRTIRCRAVDAAGKDVKMTGPSGQTGLNGQDVDMATWSNYLIDDYCTEFLSEFSGVNMNLSSTLTPADRINSYSQATEGAHVTGNGNGTGDSIAGCSEPNEMMNSQLFQLPQQHQSLIPRSKLKESDLPTGMMRQGPTRSLHTTDVQKGDLTSSNLMQLNGDKGLTNFSNFSRPIAWVKANVQCPMESTVTQPMSGLEGVAELHGRLTSVVAMADSKLFSQPRQGMASMEKSDAICDRDAAENSKRHNKINRSVKDQRSADHMKCHSSSFMESAAVVECETHKHPEAVVASPSMCSANGAAAEPNLVKNRGKRKIQEGEESGYQSEDFEDDSFDANKPIPGRGTSTKRSRAAQVHNLSERRRRDRINEKMHALQELIPNCNKVDKASVLDEAIEYVKTLQMQVQIMSVRGGLCMPPMILPPGVCAPQVGPFAPMGMGMGMSLGMGMGMGMGMLDITGSPMLPLPLMHGPQCPCPAIPRVPMTSNLQMFGIPAQAPMPVPFPTPFFPLTAMPMNVNPLAEVTRDPAQVTDSAPQNSKDQQLQTPNPVAKADTHNSQGNKGGNDECSVVDIDNQASHVCGSQTSNSKDVVSSSSMTSMCNSDTSFSLPALADMLSNSGSEEDAIHTNYMYTLQKIHSH